MCKTHPKTMQHAHVIGFGLGNARQTCLMLDIITVQILPTLVLTLINTAHSVYFERFHGVYHACEVPSSPPRASIMSIMRPFWTPNFLLDATHMRFQHPSNTLSMLRWDTPGKMDGSYDFVCAFYGACVFSFWISASRIFGLIGRTLVLKLWYLNPSRHQQAGVHGMYKRCVSMQHFHKPCPNRWSPLLRK